MTESNVFWERWRPVLRVLLPIFIVVAGGLIAVLLFKSRATPATEKPPVFAPLVECIELQPTSTRLNVTAFGTVQPRTTTALVAEVTARVVSVSPALEVGGFFDAGEVLIEFERSDYEFALVQARGQVAEAQLALSMELAEAESAVEEWEASSNDRPPELVQRLPQVAAARARLRSAEAAVDAAQLDLERTSVRAPFRGRVRDKQVDIGQFVSRGTRLAEVYTIDAVEIRLPLHDRDLAFIDLPLNGRAGPSSDEASGPEVMIRAEFGGTRHEWRGEIVRTEGEIAERSRMVYAIAEVRDPYGPAEGSNGTTNGSGTTSLAKTTPLLLGMFVEATILGNRVDDAFLLPRDAMRGNDRILIVRPDDTLELREIEPVRSANGIVCVREGITAGERLCTTRLEVFTEGMKVRVAGSPETPSPGATSTGESVR